MLKDNVSEKDIDQLEKANEHEEYSRNKIRGFIQENVSVRKKVNAKIKELEQLRLEYDDIANTDLFDMTFEKYHRKDSLNNYLNSQTMQLSSYLASGDGNTGGNIGQQLAFIIRDLLNSDKELKRMYEESKNNKRDAEVNKTYKETFDKKRESLLQYTLCELQELFKVSGEKHSVETNLKRGVKRIYNQVYW